MRVHQNNCLPDNGLFVVCESPDPDSPRGFTFSKKCPTKCHLRSTGQAGSGNDYAEWVRAQNDAYQSEMAKRLIEAVADTGSAVTLPAAEDLKTATWRLALDLPVQAGDMEA